MGGGGGVGVVGSERGVKGMGVGGGALSDKKGLKLVMS